MHIHAAVDGDGLAVHEIAVVGGEEDRGANEIGGILFALKNRGACVGWQVARGS